MQILTKGQQTWQKFDSFNNKGFSFNNFFLKKNQLQGTALSQVKEAWFKKNWNYSHKRIRYDIVDFDFLWYEMGCENYSRIIHNEAVKPAY